MASPKSAVSNAFKVEDATIAELQSAMERQEISAIALVDYYLKRIEQFNKQLNAVISVNARARETAILLDKERTAGRLRGSLHGIPIVIKDNIDTADLPTTGGCLALKDLQPKKDAFVVMKLKEAGAIILGKANLHELACSGESVSSLGGQVRNPYNLGYTPGGSSGGTAVAIAANLAAAGLGTDAVNSVRSPASACNVIGLKPTTGLVSRGGLMSLCLSQDVIGPMGRSVADVATLLELIGTDDPCDPMTAQSTGKSRSNYRACLKVSGLKQKRLGVVRSLFGERKAHQEVTGIVDQAISTMEELGAHSTVVPVNIDIDKMVEELSLVVLEGKLHFEQYLAQMGEAAPVSSLKALIKTGKVHASVQPLLKKMQAVDSPLGQAEYWQRLYSRRVELRQRLTSIFQHYRLDALIYPHQRQLVAAIGKAQKGRNGFLAAASGFPAIAIPAGFSKKGIPVGVELMAMPFQEAKLLKMAYAYEQKAKWRRSPQLMAD